MQTTSDLILITLAAAAIIIVVAALYFRLERLMALNFARINAAVSNLEQNANPGETSADQAALDQLAGRLEEVNARFASPAPPAEPGPAADSAPAEQPATE